MIRSWYNEKFGTKQSRWESYYAQAPSPSDRRNYLKQVGHTVNGVPVSDIQFNAMLEQIVRLLELNKNDVLLDLCCGNGFISSRLASLCKSVVGVDYSLPLLEIAKADHAPNNISYTQLNLLDAEWFKRLASNSFTKVLMYGSLQHFAKHDLERLLDSIARVSVPDAKLLFGFVPDLERRGCFYNSPSRKLKRILHCIKEGDPLGTWWDKRFISSICSKRGYESSFHPLPTILHASMYRFEAAIDLCSKSRVRSSPFVGGVFPFAIDESKATTLENATCSVLDSWSQASAATYLFHNARSAFCYAVRDSKVKRVWLPAFICPELSLALESTGVEICYYPLDQSLTPDFEVLRSQAGSYDAVVGVNYFGRPAVFGAAASGWNALRRSVPEVLLIEDCAHSLDTAGEHFGDLRIYSPRKLFGAPDGGVLVDVNGVLSPPQLREMTRSDFARPYQLRAMACNELNNDLWYSAFVEAESSMGVSDESMSELSKIVLRSLEIRPMVEKRKRNYRYLYNRLKPLTLFEEAAESWAPLGFPIVCKDRELVLRRLHSDGIFAPIHWRTLFVPQREFPNEHKLAEDILTVPCDQRYGVSDMERIVGLLRDFCK